MKHTGEFVTVIPRHASPALLDPRKVAFPYTRLPIQREATGRGFGDA
jgi:hypothetical protein